VLKITLPHRFDFGEDRQLVGEDILHPEAWDALRLQTDGPFAIPADLDAAADAQPAARDRAEAIAAVLDGWEAQHLVSYGVGTALPERWLQRVRPNLRLTLTEYAPGTVARLQELLPDADVRRHDLRDGPADGDAHLFHRLDTDLDNAGWREVFGAFGDARIVVVATEVMPVRQALYRWQLVRRMPTHASRAGWVRTRGAFEALWRRTHTARPFRAGDLEAWALEPRS
jgi:hypothetical protein